MEQKRELFFQCKGVCLTTAVMAAMSHEFEERIRQLQDSLPYDVERNLNLSAAGWQSFQSVASWH